MAKITFTDNRLQVPDHVTIPFIAGDGVGAEIMPPVLATVDEAIYHLWNGQRHITWLETFAGQTAYDKLGEWLPQSTLHAFKSHLVALKGPLNTPVGEGIRSLNVALRQQLDLYTCLRPVRWFPGVPSPLKSPEHVNMTIFRENTEDIYTGIEWNKDTAEAHHFLRFLREEMHVTQIRFPESSAFGVKPISEEGSKRLVRAAIRYAVNNRLPSVTLVHKGNIMKFTEGGFKRWGYEVAEREFRHAIFSMQHYVNIRKNHGNQAAADALIEAMKEGKVIIKDVITDAFLQNTLLKPEEYAVIAAPNLNGDYISDQLAAMVGGVGIAPGANINYETGHAVFEATHGTAPDIAGSNQANPCSLLLSAVMLLHYIGWSEAADLINRALEKCFANGKATDDLARFMTGGESLTTTAFLREVMHTLRNLQ